MIERALLFVQLADPFLRFNFFRSFESRVALGSDKARVQVDEADADIAAAAAVIVSCDAML